MAEQAKLDSSHEIEKNLKPRLVTLTRRDLLHLQGYGFFLQDHNGHYLTQIAPGEPADLAGVKDNDRIVEVNGVNVENASHSDVVDLINESGDKVIFLVVDEKTDKFYKSRSIRITSDYSNTVYISTSIDL